MTRYLDCVFYILIGWGLVSAFAAPFIGRFLSQALYDETGVDVEDARLPLDEPLSHPETAAGTGTNVLRFAPPRAISHSGSSSDTSITNRS